MRSFPSCLPFSRLFAVCCTSFAVLAVQPALAQSQDLVAAKAAALGVRAPEMNLQVSASSDVRQDTVRITLTVQIDAPDQAAAGKKLAAGVDEVLKRARVSKNINASTGSYQVWPNSNSKGKVLNWRGQGQVILESKDFDAASALAAKLGDKSAISNVSFLLSREGREAEERKLISQAAQAFRERALAGSSAFGFSGYRIIKIELGGVGSSDVVMHERAAAPMMAKDSSPSFVNVPLEPGEATVTMSISGTVVLQ